MTLENDIGNAVRRFRVEANSNAYAFERQGNIHGAQERGLIAETRYALAVRYAVRHGFLVNPWLPAGIRRNPWD